MKKALTLIGSSRKNGSTALLVEEAGRGLTDQGVETTTIFLNEKEIRGCQACYWCKRNDLAACAVEDDMQHIHTLLQEAAGVIVASPTYFSGVTAQTKTWLDRMSPYISMDLVPKLPKTTKASFIFTQNQPNPALFLPGIDAFMYAVGLSGMTQGDHLIASNLDAWIKPPVTDYPAYLEMAYRIGQDLIR